MCFVTRHLVTARIEFAKPATSAKQKYRRTVVQKDESVGRTKYECISQNRERTNERNTGGIIRKKKGEKSNDKKLNVQ